MKTFKEFVSLCEEVEDKSKALGFQATIKRQNRDGLLGSDRRISDPEKRRQKTQMKKSDPIQKTQYKKRKDIGTQKQADTRLQQPEQERGSAVVAARAAAAAKAERKEAAKKRAAAASSGQNAPKTTKSKDLVKKGTELISKTKSTEVDLRPKDQPKRKVVGMDRAARKKIIRDGGRKLRSLLIAAKSKKLGIPPEKVKLDKSFDIQ